MSGLLNNSLFLSTAAAAGGYQVERSLRFNSSDSAYLSRTPAVAGNRRTFTWAGWVKRSKLGGEQSLFTCYTPSDVYTILRFLTGDALSANQDNGGGGVWDLTTAMLFRDLSAWYHIVIAFDTTIASPSSDRIKLYVNGSRVTDFSSASYPSQNLDTNINRANEHLIGQVVSNYFYSGYLADIHFIDGQQLTPSSFTEVSATTGQLIPKAYAGTYTGNSFWLKFNDNSAATATTLGKDSFLLGNNWTPSANISVTAGAGNDSLVDTPTSYGTGNSGGDVRGNFCTLNPLKMGSFTLSNGNLDCVSTSSYGLVLGTIGMSSGKWYFETTLNGSGAANSIGIATDAVTITQYPGYDSLSWVYLADGRKINGGSRTSYGASFTTGDVIGVAFDADAGSLTFYKNGSSQGTAFTGLTSGPYFPVVGDDSSGSQAEQSLNFGQRPFAYTAPSGFEALVDTNLTAPVVAKPNTVMDVITRAGGGTTQTFATLRPGLVWEKRRDSSSNHYLFDVNRGNDNYLSSNLTSAEAASAGAFTFNTNSYTVSSGFDWPGGATVVDWVWDAGTSTVSNTAGSITSQVRANASAGFSIVTWTGTGSLATIGHGLGVAPAFIVIKRRNATTDWDSYHESLGNTKGIALNSTAAASTGSGYWDNTSPTSTVFTVNTGVQASGGTYVAYCFAPVVGYSSFGSYTGNGSADGPFVYTGFRPKFVLLKGSSFASNWHILDAARNTYNVTDSFLRPNLFTQEFNGIADGSGSAIDILSNGFKLRASFVDSNTNAASFVWAAFAESPFQYARAR